jgi:hypothetical protein
MSRTLPSVNQRFCRVSQTATLRVVTGAIGRLLWATILVLVVPSLGCSGEIDGRSPRERGDGGSAGAAGTATAGNAGKATGGSGGTAGSTAMSTLCATGQLSCAGSCVDPQRDPLHCGVCGNACAKGSVCQSGVCQVACAAGQTACGGVCKTTVSDPQNCGTCGNACAPGQFCVAGACAATCTLQPCDGAAGTECVDVMTNPGHCGGCGTPCGAGLSCRTGSCTLSCPTGLSACGTDCVDTQSNAAHCGACGTTCAAGTPCIAGHCGCPTGQTLCGGVCVDVASSAANCGSCGKTCPTGQACEAGVCRTGCSAGLLQCGASCVDTKTSLSHCGACDRACSAAQSCVNGTCTCPSGTLCGTSCVDTLADEAHCGTCTTSCFAGQTCTNGTCTCPTGQMACGTACVDLQTSTDHCGGCNEGCPAGSTCTAGACRCPMGQTLCGDSCVDTATNAAHCGNCSAGCAMGQTCAVGLCSGAGGVGEDGCTGGLARNIEVSRIDVFQTVGIRIVDEGEAIATSSRKTDVAAGRETVFRVFATPGSGWSARELSARVTLVNGTTSEEFFAKKSVSGASREDDPGTTFQVAVSADEVKADTRYYVELVECGTPPGDAATAPRFPATEDADLGVVATGTLRVTIIPIQSNNRLPDVSEQALEPYRALLDSIYPVSEVELTVGDQISADYPVDWNGTLDAVRAKRQSDQPDPEVYYYGLIAPTATFRDFCGGGCTAGIGFVPSLQDSSRRVSMGIGFPGDQSPGAMAHEIGHNHGRGHAPCVPQGGQISGVDGNYPYDGASIGVWGYDKRSQELIDPDGVTDMMGYCNETWVSDYTYDGLLTRTVQVNGAKLRVNPDLIGRFRVLLVDAAGPRWGRAINELVMPGGASEVAEILDENGAVLEHAVVYRTEVSDIDAASILVPEPRSGWHAVRVSGSSALSFSAPAMQ